MGLGLVLVAWVLMGGETSTTPTGQDLCTSMELGSYAD